MIKSSIENFAKDIGYDIGMSDDKVQSDLLNGFCKALYNSIQQEHDRNMQICYIVDKLDRTSEKILTEIYEFIKVKNEER